MLWNRMLTIVLVVVLALACVAPVRGQAEIRVLIINTGDTLNGWFAAGRLGYTRTRVMFEPGFLSQMRQFEWDLVILEMPQDVFTQKETVAQLLEDHVAAGGRLLVNFNNLDEWPRLRSLMGVSDARELISPLDVIKTEPRHASYSVNVPVLPWIWDPWIDSGDHLIPNSAGTVVGSFEDRTAAMVLANDNRTIVNGFDWDSYPGGGSLELIKVQIEYIMACRADLNQSTGAGVLDLFDFLDFQNLFIHQDPLANMAFDPFFDIFDFLAFQDAFVRGCN